MNVPVSVIVITQNCANDLERCLRSVQDWAQEIIVVDALSTDNTPQVAQKYGALVYSQEWQGYARQKNIAISHTTCSWILWLDSDEELTFAGREEIAQIIQKNTETNGFKLKRRTQFLNRWMDHCWGKEYVLRLFKKDSGAHFPEREVHEQLELSGEIETSPLAVINHYPYPSMAAYMQKFLRYAELFVQMNRQKKVSWWRAVGEIPVTFFKFYILKRGFLDGIPGLVLIILSSFHNFYKYICLWEAQNK